MEISPTPPEAAAVVVVSLQMDNLCVTVTPSDVSMLISDMRRSCRGAGPSPLVFLCIVSWAWELRRPHIGSAWTRRTLERFLLPTGMPGTGIY